jgi:hypothetical protein
MSGLGAVLVVLHRSTGRRTGDRTGESRRGTAGVRAMSGASLILLLVVSAGSWFRRSDVAAAPAGSGASVSSRTAFAQSPATCHSNLSQPSRITIFDGLLSQRVLMPSSHSGPPAAAHTRLRLDIRGTVASREAARAFQGHASSGRRRMPPTRPLARPTSMSKMPREFKAGSNLTHRNQILKRQLSMPKKAMSKPLLADARRLIKSCRSVA